MIKFVYFVFIIKNCTTRYVREKLQVNVLVLLLLFYPTPFFNTLVENMY